MAQAQDYMNGVRAGLSAVNVATFLGATDSTWSGNSTVAGIKAAIDALAEIAGGSKDMKEKVKRNLQLGVNSGAMAETHTATSIATAQALFTVANPSLPAAYTGQLLD